MGATSKFIVYSCGICGENCQESFIPAVARNLFMNGIINLEVVQKLDTLVERF